MTLPHDDDDFDLGALKSAVDAATPRPDPAVRAAHLRLAQENFDRLQGSADAARLNSGRPRRGALQGVRDMLNSMTSRGALTATTAIVACGLLFVTPQGRELLRGGAGDTLVPETPVTDLVAPPEPVANDAAPEIATAASDDETAEEAAPQPVPPVADSRVANETATVTPSQPMEPGRLRTEAAPATAADAAGRTMGEIAPAETEQEFGYAGGVVAPAPMMVAPLTDVDAIALAEPNTEDFANAEDNPLKITAEAPVSTFSIDVDTASYAVVRQSLMAGYLPPPEAVRVEELVNYFPYDYPAPEADGAPFRPTVTVFETPWNPDTELVHIGIQGEMPAIADRPPLNLVFLIDTSGSMEDQNKLPLLKQSFRLMVDQLRPEDQVAIVTYAGSAGLVLPPTPASDRQAILQALQNLSAGGSTNGQGGLEQAYATAAAMMADGEVTRVLLATDGDFNVGAADAGSLEDYIAGKRDTGVYLSVLGFGRGNLDDAIMQALAQNGNGTAAYIDTLNEAQKVLVDQLTGALFPIAGDVKVQVEFNPAVVAEYRLIGYETRALAREDFNNDRIDAGELGAGHTVTAIYEITPVGSPAVMNDPLRYDTEAAAPVTATSDEIGFLRLRWKDPGSDTSELMETPILQSDAAPGTDAQFAAAIAGFGQLLRDSVFLGDWGWDDAIALANANRGDDPFGYRNEAVQLMRLAQSLSQD